MATFNVKQKRICRRSTEAALRHPRRRPSCAITTRRGLRRASSTYPLVPPSWTKLHPLLSMHTAALRCSDWGNDQDCRQLAWRLQSRPRNTLSAGRCAINKVVPLPGVGQLRFKDALGTSNAIECYVRI